MLTLTFDLLPVPIVLKYTTGTGSYCSYYLLYNRAPFGLLFSADQDRDGGSFFYFFVKVLLNIILCLLDRVGGVRCGLFLGKATAPL